MKGKAAEVGRAADRGSPDVRLYLFYGPDDASARTLAACVGAGLGADAERIDLEPAQVKANVGLLADEAAALSLFGGRRWLRVVGAGDEIAEAVELLLAAPRTGNPVVVLAPAVKGTSRLVKLATADAAALACQLYAPEGAAADRLAVQLGQNEGLRLGHDVAGRIAAAASGDQAVMLREIEKIALFLDSAADRPRDVSLQDLAAIGAELPDSDTAPAVEAVLAGKPLEVGTELAAVPDTALIPLLRALVRRLLLLADLRAQIDGGARPDGVLSSVFWKEKDATAAALRRWNSPALAAAIGELRAGERALMSGAPDARTRTAVLTLARRLDQRR